MIRAVFAFGIGYVLGSRAGRERYAQIQQVTKQLSQQLGRPRAPATGGTDIR